MFIYSKVYSFIGTTNQQQPLVDPTGSRRFVCVGIPAGKKETKPKLPTFGKYKAVAMHQQTISSDQLIKEACEQNPISEGVMTAAIIRLSEVINRHLRQDDRVLLRDWGLIKLEIESDKVDNLEDFRAKKHIRGVRLHFIPESSNASQTLGDSIAFEKKST